MPKTNDDDDEEETGPATVPEGAREERRILNPREDAERAARRLADQERQHRPIYPQPGDPDRQGGESSPAPDKRRKGHERRAP